MYQPNHSNYPQQNYGNQYGNHHQQQPMNYGGNQQNNMQQGKFDFAQYIDFTYTNPGSTQIQSDKTNNQKEMLNSFQSVQIPKIDSIQKILNDCGELKRDYDNIIGLSFDLNTFIIQSSSGGSNNNNNQPSGNSYNNNNSSNTFSNSSNMNSHYPYNQQNNQQTQHEKDVARFQTKFQCSKEMADGYLAAFGNYDEAEKQFIINTGWTQPK